MITAEEVTMKYSHFRLRVDLSKFFHDVRRFCWIFIDGTKIQKVIHIKQHISKLFNIAEPFHLLLNDAEYLPPTEDVRVLKESEIILVVPGSGLSDKSVMIETHNDSTHNEEVSKTNAKAIFPRDALYKSNISLDRKRPTLTSCFNYTAICNTTKDKLYNISDDNEYTIIDNTEQNIGTVADEVTDINLTEDCNGTDSIVPKRKRVRTRKPKKRHSPVLSADKNEKNLSKKPKIIDSHVIYPGVKHIRFDNIENDNICSSIVEEPAVRKVLSEDHRKEPGFEDLNTLLVLGQTSTPLTFVNKKINDIKVTKVSTNKIDNSVAKHLLQIDSTNVDRSKEDNKKLQKCEISSINLEKIPVMTKKPEIKDIIAFKTLKIGADYTPQESNFIITEVVGLCTQSANYTLKILDGKEEVQVPIGKFHISENESADECEADTFLLNYSQMRELRLIP